MQNIIPTQGPSHQGPWWNFPVENRWSVLICLTAGRVPGSRCTNISFLPSARAAYGAKK